MCCTQYFKHRTNCFETLGVITRLIELSNSDIFQDTLVLDAGRIKEPELSHNLTEKTEDFEETTNAEEMPSGHASKLPDNDDWFSLLSKMVVGVPVLLTSEDTENTEEHATAKMAKVVPGQMMYTVSLNP